MRVLRARFVRTVGERDRIYVTRSDGSAASWVFPTYGDGLPHDLVHLVVESAFSLGDGFWGRVDAGADPARVTAEANRRGGPDKYAAYGQDRSGLMRAEALANVRWLEAASDADALRAQALAACATLEVTPPAVAAATCAEVRAVLGALGARWRGMEPKGALELAFHADVPARGFALLPRC